MALTKVTGQVIKNTTDVTVGVLTVTNTLAVGGTVSIGGTLTYEDVTNVDAVGLITARNGIVVGSGITLSKDGDVFFTGIATGNGSGLTAINASNISSGTVPTARLGSGTASSSTFLRGDSTFAAVTSTTINNNADNRVITGSGTANTLNGESTLTYNGIGALNVLGASGNTQLSLTRSDANTSGTTGTIGFYASDNHAVAGLYALGDGDNEGAHLVFKTTSAASGTSVYSNVDERLRITSDGKIGVNVTTPQKLLDVRGEFAISNSNTSYWDFDRDDSDGSLKIKDTGTERLRITSAGRLGVGIAAPTKLLDIATATSADGIRIRSTGNTYNELSFDANRTSANTHISRIISHWNGTAVSYISMDAGSDTTNKDDGMIRFWTANGSGNYERLRIDSSGNLGINNTSPTHKLDIDNGTAKVNRGNSSGEILILRGLNADKFRFDTDGLKFGTDTAAANALDDYEEGTFTSEIVQGLGTLSATYDSTGRYTKIGRFVHVQAIIQFGGVGNGTQVRLKLPFTHVTSTALGGGVISFTNVAGLQGESTLTLIGASGQSYCAVQNKNSNPSISGTQNNQVIYYHFSYEAA